MSTKYPTDNENVPLDVDDDLIHGAEGETIDEAAQPVDAQALAQEAEEARLRALAEMENFKKRLQRQHEEQLQYAAEKVLADLLPTLDNFDLALQYGSKDEACQGVITGVEMTRKLLLDTLKNHGLEQVGSVGEEFDPNLHEALGTEEHPDLAPGTVSQVMQRGYKLKDRLLRPAKVMITPQDGKRLNCTV